jgi:hypothetical protein
MPASLRVVLLAALAALVGCGRTTYETQGDVLAVDAGVATIAHDAIPGVAEAATTRFVARPASVLDGVRPGMRVRLDLVRDGDALILVGLHPSGDASATAVHDHGPRHGGVVGKANGVHVEIAASRDGRLRAWLTDEARRPLPVRQAIGTVRLRLPGRGVALTLTPAGDALEARGEPFDAESALADVSIAYEKKQLDLTVLLDLTGTRAGMSIPPQTDCVPVPAAVAGRTPRCFVTFTNAFTAIGTTPGGGRAIVAVSHSPMSVWSLPEATLRMGLEPLPPIGVAPGAHEPDPRAIAVRPDGIEIAVAAGPRLVFYDAATGRLRRKLEGPGGTIRAMAWSPDGRSLLLAASGDTTVRLVDSADGRVVRTIAAGGPVLTVAMDASGRWPAAGTETGTIVIDDVAADGEARLVTPSTQSLEAVAFARDRLLAAGADGTLRVVDPTTGAETARADVGVALRLLAIAPDGRHAATADAERVVRVHRLPDASVVERLDGHRANVAVLAWGTGQTLLSGDTDAMLAVWDVPAVR